MPLLDPPATSLIDPSKLDRDPLGASQTCPDRTKSIVSPDSPIAPTVLLPRQCTPYVFGIPDFITVCVCVLYVADSGVRSCYHIAAQCSAGSS